MVIVTRFCQEREENMSKLTLALSAGLALSAAATARPLYNGAGAAIPDLSSVSVNINVGDSFSVTGASVSFQGLAHTWVGDLQMTLSHGATTISLINRPGFTGSGFGYSGDFAGSNSYGWADGGTAFPTTGPTIVPSGTYAPVNAFSAFNGSNSSGTWTLTVTDNAGGDVGQFNGWTLNLVPTPGAAALFGVAGLAGLRRRR